MIIHMSTCKCVTTIDFRVHSKRQKYEQSLVTKERIELNSNERLNTVKKKGKKK